ETFRAAADGAAGLRHGDARQPRQGALRGAAPRGPAACRMADPLPLGRGRGVPHHCRGRPCRGSGRCAAAARPQAVHHLPRPAPGRGRGGGEFPSHPSPAGRGDGRRHLPAERRHRPPLRAGECAAAGGGRPLGLPPRPRRGGRGEDRCARSFARRGGGLRLADGGLARPLARRIPGAGRVLGAL
ncbi:MAG: hypothetical protein AVDCRST_MAG27-4675, partial [uncultured Craurococcus sp.]